MSNETYRIAVLGDQDSVLGFQALGLDVYPAETAEEARPILHRLARENTAIVYLTEELAAGMEAELNAMVDQGCTVLDVIVEHPIYGQLTGPLQLASRYDVAQFLARCSQPDARPLSELTEGIHLHTLSCPDEAAFDRVRQELRRLGILLEE